MARRMCAQNGGGRCTYGTEGRRKGGPGTLVPGSVTSRRAMRLSGDHALRNVRKVVLRRARRERGVAFVCAGAWRRGRRGIGMPRKWKLENAPVRKSFAGANSTTARSQLRHCFLEWNDRGELRDVYRFRILSPDLGR
jgi:hypothetical protein